MNVLMNVSAACFSWTLKELIFKVKPYIQSQIHEK